jgi:hypothetical protein
VQLRLEAQRLSRNAAASLPASGSEYPDWLARLLKDDEIFGNHNHYQAFRPSTAEVNYLVSIPGKISASNELGIRYNRWTTAAESLNAAQTVSELTETRMVATRKMLTIGEASNFQMGQEMRTFNDAALSELRAIRDYRKAQIDVEALLMKPNGPVQR